MHELERSSFSPPLIRSYGMREFSWPCGLGGIHVAARRDVVFRRHNICKLRLNMHDEIPQLLLVEADELLSEITSFRLELSGFQVRTARTGGETLTALRGDLPDVIIIDLTLPDMEGVDLINQLSNDARTNCVPVLAFSIDADVHAVQRAYAAGAKDLLVIPYDPYVLEEKLEQLLQAAAPA